MSDGAAETIPAPRTDVDGAAIEPASPSTSDSGPSFSARASVVADRVQEQAGEVAERVGDAMERAAAATGRFASSMAERIRNEAEFQQGRGTTTIAHEVVEKIAGIAAREVDGVYDLGGDVARAFAAVRERIGLGDAESVNKGVGVRLDGKTAAIDITIVIEYGFVVYTVTEKVRASVLSRAETLLGLEVTEVNIVVDDVHVADAPAA